MKSKSVMDLYVEASRKTQDSDQQLNPSSLFTNNGSRDQKEGPQKSEHKPLAPTAKEQSNYNLDTSREGSGKSTLLLKPKAQPIASDDNVLQSPLNGQQMALLFAPPSPRSMSNLGTTGHPIIGGNHSSLFQEVVPRRNRAARGQDMGSGSLTGTCDSSRSSPPSDMNPGQILRTNGHAVIPVAALRDLTEVNHHRKSPTGYGSLGKRPGYDLVEMQMPQGLYGLAQADASVHTPTLGHPGDVNRSASFDAPWDVKLSSNPTPGIGGNFAGRISPANGSAQRPGDAPLFFFEGLWCRGC
jgi:hypothetical protein